MGVRTCAHTSMECVHVHWCIQLHQGALPAPASPTTNLTAATRQCARGWGVSSSALLSSTFGGTSGPNWVHMDAYLCMVSHIHAS